MNIQKQIKELQERNRERFRKKWGRFYLDEKTSDWEKPELDIGNNACAVGSDDIENYLDQLTTDSFNQGALAMIEEMRDNGIGNKSELKFDSESPVYEKLMAEQEGWNDHRQRVMAHLTILEAKIKE